MQHTVYQYPGVSGLFTHNSCEFSIMNDYKLLRKEVARFMRRLYNRGLTTASGGNISVRLHDTYTYYPISP